MLTLNYCEDTFLPEKYKDYGRVLGLRGRIGPLQRRGNGKES